MSGGAPCVRIIQIMSFPDGISSTEVTIFIPMLLRFLIT